MDMLRRILSHTSNSRSKHSTSYLYSILHTIGIEHFTFLYVPVPPFLRKALEKQLIHWFKPSLNMQHKGDFKSNIVQDPSIPPALKPALISFKQTHPTCEASYNINSACFKKPTSLAKHTTSSTSSFPSSFTQYHDPDRKLTAINLLSLITDFSHKFIFKPFHVDVTYGETDLTNFSFIQTEMEKSYAFGSTYDDGNIVYLSVDKLISHLKSNTISSFLFVPFAPNVLLKFHTSSVVLPAIAKGNLSAMTVLNNCHPYELFNLYNQCGRMSSLLLQSLAKQKLSDLCFQLFHSRPTKTIPFIIKVNEALSQNKVKTVLFSFLKTLPISINMLLLLQMQTKVVFKSHPKTAVLFCNHIAWCRKWSEKPFTCNCASLFPILWAQPYRSTHFHPWPFNFIHL